MKTEKRKCTIIFHLDMHIGEVDSYTGNKVSSHLICSN